MAGLARGLATQGFKVTYVASELVSASRAEQGWAVPDLAGVSLERHPGVKQLDRWVMQFSRNAVHIAQGLKRNGYIADAVSALRRRHARWGAIMESVDDRGARGWIKRLDYASVLGRRSVRPDFVLGIGLRTPGWIAARGFPCDRVFPFAYFLEPPQTLQRVPDGPFRFGFIGQTIRRKRLDLLIDALRDLGSLPFQLVVVGGGLLESELKAMAEARLGAERVRWVGRVPMDSARSEAATLDCLVLPSEHDGWGAVVSEALMAGVPAICSDACGSAVAVLSSGEGGVFPSGNAAALSALLQQCVENGRPNAALRASLSRWASCLSGIAGATYLREVIGAVYEGRERPSAPWSDVGYL